MSPLYLVFGEVTLSSDIACLVEERPGSIPDFEENLVCLEGRQFKKNFSDDFGGLLPRS